jgi:hypothetical protein
MPPPVDLVREWAPTERGRREAVRAGLAESKAAASIRRVSREKLGEVFVSEEDDVL